MNTLTPYDFPLVSMRAIDARIEGRTKLEMTLYSLAGGSTS